MSAKARINHTVPCTSPVLKWFPAKEQGNIWNLTYTDSSWSTYQPNTRGQGRPGHSSSLNGSSVDFGWTGGDLWFYGQVEDDGEVGVGYEVTCDGQKNRAYVLDNDEGNLLGGCRGLTEGQHEAKLMLDGSRTVLCMSRRRSMQVLSHWRQPSRHFMTIGGTKQGRRLPRDDCEELENTRCNTTI